MLASKGARFEIAVVGMDHGVDLSEGQELVPAFVAEKFVHRVRPIHPAVGDIPVEQPAAPAGEGRVDPAPHLLADLVHSFPERLVVPVDGDEHLLV